MIRYLMIFAFILLLSSCSNDPGSISAPQDNSANKVVLGPQEIAVSQATPIQCPAGGSVFSIYNDQNSNGKLDSSDILISTQIVCNGERGATGATGASGSSGANGLNMVFQTVAASQNSCPAGGLTILMAIDSDHSGTVTSSDQNFQSATLCNGQNAPVLSYTPVEPIIACGNQVAYKEVLLRLSNGQVLGSFSQDASGTMTRLSFLPDGTYMNTDTSGCIFSLSTSADQTSRSISWFGKVQKTWPMVP